MTTEPEENNTSVSPLTKDLPVLLVFMGASNLSRGCFALSRHIKACLHPRSVEVLIASGPGRAYHASGGLLNVTYPPILLSQLFEVARSKAESGYHVIALVTDIGNDIMYGVSAEQVIETIQRIFEKLHTMNAKIFYTTLPTEYEKGIHPFRFRVLRSLLFPYSSVSHEVATSGIIEVNRFLRASESRNVHWISDMDRHLGLDGIHYGWLRAHHAWSCVAGEMLEALGTKMENEISLATMIRSYWEEFRQVVGSDMLGFKKNNPGHF